MLLSGNCLFSQNTIVFGYDDNGNRTSRVLSASKSRKVEFPLTESQFKEELSEEHESPVSLNIYPNPTAGILRIDIETGTTYNVSEYHIYDLNGNKMLTGNIYPGSSELDVSSLKNGLYVLRIILGDMVYDWKIIKSGY